MKNETLGRMDCPECGAKGAAIKKDKSGRLYRWCMDGCGAKFHARDEDQEYMMRKHLFEESREGRVPDGNQKHEPAKSEKPVGGFTLGGLR
jgi:hypothetical protein